jgi:uncharacterized tellurite resistance protein B-like protein
MFDRLTAFLSGLSGPAKPRPDDANDPRVAAAALLVHVAEADGERGPEETEALHGVIAQAYGLSAEEARDIAARGAFADQAAVDFYPFARTLTRALDRAQRRDFVAMMWEVAFADGRLAETEDHTLWRIAEILGIEQAERIALRKLVQARRAGQGNGEA